MSPENKKCKYCKNTIPADAEVCPICRKKQTSSFERGATIVLSCIIAVSFVGLFFNRTISRDDSTLAQPQQYEEYLETPDNNQAIESPAQETPVPNSNTLVLGQTADLNGIAVTLNSVSEFDGGDDYTRDRLGNNRIFLMLNLTVQNNTDEDISVFDVSYNGYVDDQNVDVTFEGDDILRADYLIPGSYEKGYIAFEVPKNWQNFQLRLQESYDGPTANFMVNRNQLTPYQSKHHNDHDYDDFGDYDD